MFLHHDGVGAGGNGRPGEDAGRTARVQMRGATVARRDPVPEGQVPRTRAIEVAEADREAVHRGIVAGRQRGNPSHSERAMTRVRPASSGSSCDSTSQT